MPQLSRHLPRFGPGPSSTDPLAVLVPARSLPATVDDAADPPPSDWRSEDPAAVIEATREAGRAEGRRAAELAFQEERARLERSAEERVREARRTWTETEGAAIRAALEDGLCALEERLSNALADALAPVIDAAIRGQAMAEIADVVVDLLRGGRSQMLEITGPSDLLEVLAGRLEGAGLPVRVAPDDDLPEVRVIADVTVFETRLARWRERWASALEPRP